MQVLRALVAGSMACLALAGCSAGDGAARPSEPTTSTGSSPGLDGVVLEVVRTDSGERHTLDATVRNTGLWSYYFLWVPQCDLHPWSDRMAGPDGPVQPREPGAHCLPCGRDVLSPGESMSRSFGWDERVWDMDQERMRDAPDGRYVWTVSFRAEPDEDDVCGGDRAVSVDVEVEVG
ncbi:MAG TPA: hypothetical protein VJ874_00980 [Candidatus Thermoplasmatota archaeon]|nr:hypothetical protein [Candidatus Thermoplasmatota archaeon]